VGAARPARVAEHRARAFLLQRPAASRRQSVKNFHRKNTENYADKNRKKLAKYAIRSSSESNRVLFFA
jgi:hypothetical protein